MSAPLLPRPPSPPPATVPSQACLGEADEVARIANQPEDSTAEELDAAEEQAASARPSPANDLDTCICLEFEAGNPAVELITGRLYLAEAPPPMRAAASDEDALLLDEEEDLLMTPLGEESEDDSHPRASLRPSNRFGTRLVYVFDIPAHLTLNEFHAFLLDATDLVHVQLVRVPTRKSATDPTYSAMLEFRSAERATAFVREYDGVAYNSLEPEVCVTGLLVRVAFDEDEKYSFPISPEHGASTPIPHLTLGKAAHTRDVHSPSIMPLAPSLQAAAAAAAAAASSTMLLPPAAAAAAASAALSLTPSHTPALGGASDPSASCPSCPVCLEVILPTSASPMLTILCHHVFHFDCLSKWIPSSSNSSCPVCRYMLQPNVNTQCAKCKATDKLWLCILCGHVGCSRYTLGHAHQHFEQTSHNYAIEVLTQRVWDYAADCYVHRLVRNKTDGKLVELSRVRTLDDDLVQTERSTKAATGDLPATTSQAASAAAAATPSAASSRAPSSVAPSSSRPPFVLQPSSSAYASVKLEEFLLEYNYLLSSQLDQQRRVFQHQLKQSETDMQERRLLVEKELERSQARGRDLEKKVVGARAHKAEQEAKLVHLQASLASLQAQSHQLTNLHAKLLEDHSSVRAARQTSAKLYEAQQESILRGQDEAIAALTEQAHDLAFFLETQKKIDKMDERSRRGGKAIGLKERLMSGQASLQLVEVGADEDECKQGKMRKGKRR